MCNDLYGEKHEQEENGLFGKRHQAEEERKGSGCNGCRWDRKKGSAAICVQCDRFYLNKTIKPDLYKS